MPTAYVYPLDSDQSIHTRLPCPACRQFIDGLAYPEHVIDCLHALATATPIITLFFPLMAPGVAELNASAASAFITMFPSMLFNDDDLDAWVSDTLGVVYVGVDNVDEVTEQICGVVGGVGGADGADGANGICPICQDTVSEAARRTRSCRHVFCAHCIEKWLSMSKKCPVCMTEQIASPTPPPATKVPAPLGSATASPGTRTNESRQ